MSSSKPFRTYQRSSKSKSSDSVDFIPTVPRAPKTRSSHSVPARDSSLFVSPEAASFFDDVVSKRKFVPERSYQIGAFPEFYSNFPADPKRSNFHIVVRSVPITLRPSIINRVLDFRSCPGFDSEKFTLASSQYTVDLFKTMAYTDQTMPLTSKGLLLKSYLPPFYKFLWDFIRHNVLPTRNNSNPTLAGCQLMISMVNHDKIPFEDILYHAILGKTVGHGTKHKGTLVFRCLIQRLCERNNVVFHDSD
ncbi:unnamed protein product [Prunus brigantina]